MLAELATLMTFNPVTVSPTQSLVEMVELLNEVDFHHWPVVDDDQRLIGILSDLDIVRAVQERSLSLSIVDGRTLHDRLQQCFVQDLMTRDVKTIPVGSPPRYALQQLLREGFHALPVVDRRRVVGLLTSTDFLREWSYGDHPASHEAVQTMMERTADPLELDASLDDAFASMQLTETEFVGVIRGGLPLGVVTRRSVRLARMRLSIQMHLGPKLPLRGPTSLLDLVSNAELLRPGTRLHEAAGSMLERQTQALAVVNQAGRLMGAVSESSLLRAMHVAF